MKIIQLLLLSLFSLGMTAQGVWFDTGLKVQYGAAGLINSAVSDSPDWNYDVGSALSFGGKLGINIESNGFTIDVMRMSTTSKFERSGDASNVETTISALDLYLLYRSSRYRGYIEIGPKLSFVNSATNNDFTTGAEIDATESFQNGYSAVLGFGTYVIGNDGRFSGIFGLRIEYGFSDFQNETNATASNAPVFSGSNVYGDGYQKGAPVFAGLVFELNWGIGYYGKASCGQRGKFIFL